MECVPHRRLLLFVSKNSHAILSLSHEYQNRKDDSGLVYECPTRSFQSIFKSCHHHLRLLGQHALPQRKYSSTVSSPARLRKSIPRDIGTAEVKSWNYFRAGSPSRPSINNRRRDLGTRDAQLCLKIILTLDRKVNKRLGGSKALTSHNHHRYPKRAGA